MNEPYLPRWATAEEAREWLEFKTEQSWPLARILETQPKAGFHLVPAQDTDAETMRRVFGGDHGGCMVLIQPGDMTTLAASRSGLRVSMVGLLNGECIRVDKPMNVPIEEVRFSRDDLEKITQRIAEGAQFSKPPGPLVLGLDEGLQLTLPHYGAELHGLPVSVELVEFVPVVKPKVEAPSATPAKPLQRSAAQDAAILAAIHRVGFNPLSLPVNPSGKPGVKAVIREALAGVNNLFPRKGRVFDKAWERLRQQGDIADSP